MLMVNGSLVVKESELDKLNELQLVKFQNDTPHVTYRGTLFPFKVEAGK